MKLLNYFYFRLYLLGVRLDKFWNYDLYYIYVPISISMILEILSFFCIIGEIQLIMGNNYLSYIDKYIGKAFVYIFFFTLLFVNYLYYIRKSRWKIVVGKFQNKKFKNKLDKNIYDITTVMVVIVLYISMIIWFLSIMSRLNPEISRGRLIY